MAKKNNVWTAHQFTKIRVPNRVPGGDLTTPEGTETKIMTHFFPVADNPAPKKAAMRHDIRQDSDLEWASEVSSALTKCSNTLATGLDQVPYGVWKGIQSVNPNIIPALIKDMLT